MKVSYSYQGIRFEWDSLKASENLKQHGIPFETACEAFLDPFVWMVDDEGGQKNRESTQGGILNAVVAV